MNSTGRNPSLAHITTSSEPSSVNTIHNHFSSFTRVLHQTSGMQNLFARPKTSFQTHAHRRTDFFASGPFLIPRIKHIHICNSFQSNLFNVQLGLTEWFLNICGCPGLSLESPASLTRFRCDNNIKSGKMLCNCPRGQMGSGCSSISICGLHYCRTRIE